MKWTLVVTMLAGCLGAPPESIGNARNADRDASFDDVLDMIEAAPARIGQPLRRTVPRPRTLGELTTATLRIYGDRDAVPRLVTKWAEHPVAVRAAMIAACEAVRADARRAVANTIQMRVDEIARVLHVDPTVLAPAVPALFDRALASPGTAVQKQLGDHLERFVRERRSAHRL